MIAKTISLIKIIIPVLLVLAGISCVRQDSPVEPHSDARHAPSPVPGLAVQAADLLIYGDALESPWLNSSWSADVSFASTEQVYEGSNAIKVVMTSAWAALSLHHGYWYSNPGIDPTSYEALEFTVYTPSTGMKMAVFLENDDGHAFPKVDLGSVTAGQWVTVSIPMAQLSPDGVLFHRISIQELSGSTRTFYVDNLLLSGSDTETDPVVPSAPTLASPENGATGVETNPTLAWNPVNDAASYRVQLAATSDFASPVADQANLTGTTYSVSGLSNSTTYFWRVNASNSAGTSDWSASWQFTTRAASADAPDLTIDAERLEESIDIRWKSFSSSNCAVVEGCASPGSRRLLRFDVVVMNFGEKDLFMGNPATNPDQFEWSPCHGHYHYEGFAEYRLLQGGQRLVAGNKQAFCLMDSKRYWSGYPSQGYDCDWQGISVGWADVYARSIDCQWIDITDISPGNYVLEVEVNYAGKIDEGDNQWPNVVQVPVQIR